MANQTVPAFLTKLWTLVENPEYNHLICWDPSGKSFHLYNQADFAKELLPLYFKHGNIASFIRQLNMYGFRKVLNIEHGLKSERDDVEFQHPYFQRDQEHLLEYIRRKPTQHHIPVSMVKSEHGGYQIESDGMEKLLDDVHNMKGKQDSMNNKLDAMKRENEVLWREVASLRQKHIKQQQIVNKLIQFLVHIVRPNRSVPSKRKLPLMISDTSHNDAKMAKYTGHNDAKVAKYGIPLHDPYTVQSPSSATYGETPSSGPIISEIVEENPSLRTSPAPPSLDSSSASQLSLPPDMLASSQTGGQLGEYSLKPDELQLFTSQILPEAHGDLGRPLSVSDLVNLEAEATAPEPPPQNPTQFSRNLVKPNVEVSQPVQEYELAMAIPNSNTNDTSKDQDEHKNKTFSRQKSINEVTDHVSTLDSDLEGIKELLSGNNFSLDTSTLLNLFNADSSLNIPGSEHLLSGVDTNHENDGNNIVGNELIQFKQDDSHVPDLFDLEALAEEDQDESNTSGDLGLYNRQSLDTPLPAQVSAEDLD